MEFMGKEEKVKKNKHLWYISTNDPMTQYVIYHYNRLFVEKL